MFLYFFVARAARVKFLEILCLKLEFLYRAEPVTNVPGHEALDLLERVIVHKHSLVALLGGKTETCQDVMKPVPS
jgi:hypothetical protein